jgi:hypothetical protein
VKCFVLLLFLLKKGAIALMEAASFCGGVRRKRYSGQQVPAPENTHVLLL